MQGQPLGCPWFGCGQGKPCPYTRAPPTNQRRVGWCFPKGTDFAKITDESALGGARVESLINNRPRKCLGYKTPLEVASSFVALRA